MWNLLVSILLLIGVAIKDIANEKNWKLKLLIGGICVVAAYLACSFYEENKDFAEKLSHIETLSTQVDTLEAKIDTLTVIEKKKAGEIVILNRGIDSLLSKRARLEGQISTLSTQHDSLLLVNDSLLRLSNLQLSGVLEAIIFKPLLTAAGDSETVIIFRSSYPQDLQDISIYLEFDNQYQHAIIEQETSTSYLNVSCRKQIFDRPSRKLSYSCGFLAKGNYLQLKVYSKQTISVVTYKHQP